MAACCGCDLNGTMVDCNYERRRYQQIAFVEMLRWSTTLLAISMASRFPAIAKSDDTTIGISQDTEIVRYLAADLDGIALVTNSER